MTTQIIAPCGQPFLYAAENLSLYHAWEQPKQGREHTHEELQISLPLSGSYHADWETAGGQRRTRNLSPGALLLCSSHQPHTIQVDRSVELAAVWLPASFVSHVAEELDTAGPVEIADTGRAHDPLLRQLCLSILAEVRQNQTPARLYIDSMATALAAHLTHHHSRQGETAKEITGGLSPRRLTRVLTYVRDNLDRDISLADLAAVAGLSPSHFGPLFRRSTGLTPYRYVLIQRIEQGKSLLGNAYLSVGEVAAQVGFCDQSQFTRQFKRHTGLTPKAYAVHTQG